MISIDYMLYERLTQMKAAVRPMETSPHVKRYRIYSRCVFVCDTTGIAAKATTLQNLYLDVCEPKDC